ncbi:MAG: phage tail protein [Acidimicrobiia bacterium]
MSFVGPLPAFNFYIMLVEHGASTLASAASVAGAVLGGFTECSGLESEIEVEDRQVGGVNDRVFRFPGRASHPSITLKRGVAFSEDLYLWHQAFLKGEGIRRDGLVLLANEARVPIKTWSFERAIPKKWSGPSLSSNTSALAFESLEIVHERLTLVSSPGLAAAALPDLF